VADQKRVLILGSDSFRTQRRELLIVSKRWDQVGANVNIRDYDVLILNLLSVGDPKDVAWPQVEAQLNRGTVIDLLQSGGEIVVLGDPRFRWTHGQTESQQIDAPGGLVDFLDWTAMTFDWDDSPGTSGKPAVDEQQLPPAFRNYLASISRWEYSLRGVKLGFSPEQRETRVYVRLERYWENRYRQPVVFACWLVLDPDYARTESFGPITFLPRAGVTEPETIEAALALADVELETPEPDWLANVSAPGQRPIDERLNDLNARLRELWEEHQITTGEKAERRRLLGLLYEKQLGLEPLVRDALRKLGADVTDPGEGDREDGWIKVRVDDEELKGVLEIKSTRSSTFDEQGLRQLEEWKLNGEQRGKDFKGIFIGSRDLGRPVAERSTEPFGVGWRRSAAKRDIVGVLTETLYIGLALHAEGRLDVDRFWRDLFATGGVFNPSSLGEQFAIEMPDEAQVLFGRQADKETSG
jgi:hypothetical protein